jgi:hypothetical protein
MAADISRIRSCLQSYCKGNDKKKERIEVPTANSIGGRRDKIINECRHHTGNSSPEACHQYNLHMS